ncbi:HD domain-containing protein [Pseudodesulfovibrio sp. JC047]|uniref:HD-GYP domain-containing protein n=1 Tax=Pseudodesulfovibrio sp. JC047 TaxID=2683199 RepID=UPI0013D02A03|nr:HD domain-containing phosphohydrolase [Pseudodesulfovibrio sp. JC047]NDV18430.1 HD domain-containing protein [Pseudodesulfovibrio sp. JC047]
MNDISAQDSLKEVYLQISPNILESFPKFRPPVDVYVFDDAVAQVKKYHKAGERLGTSGQQEISQLAALGRVFLLRDDYQEYAKHLSKRLGLLLVEEGLTDTEVAETFFLAFRDRMDQFFAQPQRREFDLLVKDISILAEYIWIDPDRVRFLTRTLDKEYSLAVHSTNTMFIGLALHVHAAGKGVQKDGLVRVALGLILHDLGMTQVPRFIRDKKQFLVRRDRASIENHIQAGVKMVQRLSIDDPVVMACLCHHHERNDGSGYPGRRIGAEIPMAGKLCAVADSFSAMIGVRPYRSSRDVAQAALVLLRDSLRYEPTFLKLLGETLVMDGWMGETKPTRKIARV